MSDRPPENPGPPSGDPERTLTEILAALSRVGEDAAPGDAGEPDGLGGAVDELRYALDRLFDLVRTDRADQRARIAELEAALSAAHARIRKLEAGEPVDIPAPPPNDFGQLREAAERLRQRTEELFRDAGPITAEADEPADEATAVEAASAPDGLTMEVAASLDQPEDEAQARIRAARDAVEASIAHDGAVETPEPEYFSKPAVLRIFPGATGPDDEVSLDIESELDVDETADEEELIEAVAVAALPVPEEATDEPPTAEDEPIAPDASLAPTPRPEPIEIAPRPARKRRASLRRRRIDARKLAGVDPATALRAMVSAIDDIWTAGVTLDLVIALTDGGALKVVGGHNKPLAVLAVKPGTSARTTVTATTAQLVPLFGRLELTDEQSPPLIHGPRRDADLLVGWIDRAQRLDPEPL
ncbi:MAG: hypothetical protein JHD16_19155 [Solirubrobacteraceae bacterium]|nr:hypothetical protein [Solirubrobacteraceae bacterium]